VFEGGADQRLGDDRQVLFRRHDALERFVRHRSVQTVAAQQQGLVARQLALEQLTEDDSWAATVLGSRNGSTAPPATRHVLTNVLGARPETLVHLTERELAGDATLLLCSDGLHGSVPHETLRDVLISSQDLPSVAQSLITTALEHGSRDNITALVVRCSGK